MAEARPGREEEEDPRAVRARHGAPLVGLEGEERARLGVERLASGLDPNASLDDEHVGVLLDLVIAELLAGLEADENRARRLSRVEHHRGAATARRLDFLQVPAAHRLDPNRPKPAQSRHSPVTHPCGFPR